MNRRFVCLVVIVMAASSGCTVNEASPDPQVDISLAHEEFNNTNRFTFSAITSAEARGLDNNYIFSNVSVVLYDENKDVINRKTIGDLDASDPNPTNITINSTEDPKYIILESPDFWNKDVPVVVAGYVLLDDGYYGQYKYDKKSDKFNTERYSEKPRDQDLDRFGPSPSILKAPGDPVVLG